jgi:folylpolyglutamate synthase
MSYPFPDELLVLTSQQDAIDALNTLQTPYAVIEARRKAGIKPDASSLAEMRTYLGRIGHSVCMSWRLDPLQCLHTPSGDNYGWLTLRASRVISTA